MLPICQPIASFHIDIWAIQPRPAIAIVGAGCVQARGCLLMMDRVRVRVELLMIGLG